MTDPTFPTPADPDSSPAVRSAGEFESLIAEISGRFVTLPPEEIDEAVTRALEPIGRFMGGDRCFIFLLNAEGTSHYVAHVWTARQIPDDPVVVGVVIQEGFPWVGEKMTRHEDIVVDRVADLPEEAALERAYCDLTGIQSFLMCPMYSGDLVVGAIGIDAIRTPRAWSAVDRRRLRLLGGIVAHEVVRKRATLARESDALEIRTLKEQLEAENRYLRREVEQARDQLEVVAESDTMKQVLHLAEQVATTDATVLLRGETGVGKEVVARAIHRMSHRKGRPLIGVNCAALSPSLVESELFGREKGAYTGALARQAGRFEVADRATIFLDEVGELSLEVQAKLLRVLQSGEFERLGSTTTLHADVRVIAATNRDLEKAIKDGAFREDLFYRLNVFPLDVPPLRARRDDIPLLVWSIVRELEATVGRSIQGIPDETMSALVGHEWPGNVRELRNVLERAVILNHDGQLVTNLGLPASPAATPRRMPKTVAQMEREHIQAVLERTGWRVRGTGAAAEILGLRPTTLESRMKKLGIRRP